ncbi:MAG: hypothetical protein K8T91_06490 [Planctomycetes bacterium]|nr:hypothetical protein [Planctomycetota bacterium]
MPVINPTKSHSFFLQQSGDRLTLERIAQIAYQLDRVCRDVPPPNKGE